MVEHEILDILTGEHCVYHLRQLTQPHGKAVFEFDSEKARVSFNHVCEFRCATDDTIPTERSLRWPDCRQTKRCGVRSIARWEGEQAMWLGFQAVENQVAAWKRRQDRIRSLGHRATTRMGRLGT